MAFWTSLYPNMSYTHTHTHTHTVLKSTSVLHIVKLNEDINWGELELPETKFIQEQQEYQLKKCKLEQTSGCECIEDLERTIYMGKICKEVGVQPESKQ